jgi:hypothetical protein
MMAEDMLERMHWRRHTRHASQTWWIVLQSNWERMYDYQKI